MSAEPTALEIDGGAWEARRARAQELRERHPFAAELLSLYLALLPAQEQAWRAVREHAPDPAQLAAWAAARVLPEVMRATAAAGPAALREAVRRRLAGGTAGDGLAGWLAGADLAPVDRYLARASLRPALEAASGRETRAPPAKAAMGPSARAVADRLRRRASPPPGSRWSAEGAACCARAAGRAGAAREASARRAARAERRG